MRLDNKVALVTGAGSGIGQGIAETFAREGARVALADIDFDSAKSAARAIGNNAIALRCDVAKKTEFETAVAETLAAFGRLDILVNNAGTTHVNKPMLDITEDEVERIFAVNVKGVFFGCQAVVPVFRKQGGGVIINIGSTAGLRPRPGLSAYNATKGAVHTLTKSLAVELGGDHIRVCAIAPVATDTPLLPSFLGPSPGMREKFISTVPLGRLAQVQDMANTALFLASDDAQFLTGNVVEVDGGRCV
jgi:3-oxoacyl-[acyl-carrier protein] reductase